MTRTIMRKSSAKQTLSILRSWLASEATAPPTARATFRDSRSLASSWMASAQHAEHMTVRSAQRDSLSRNLLLSWMAASPATATVSVRASARDGHSLLGSWMASFSSKPASKRASSRDTRPWALLHSWIVQEGFAKHGPARSPVSNAQLFYRWIISSGAARFGAASAPTVLARGFRPASRSALARTWLIEEGFGKNVSEFTARFVKMGLTLSAALAIGLSLVPLVQSAWSNPEVKKLVRRSSVSSARQGKQLALKLA
jgi:hypothetical protein